MQPSAAPELAPAFPRLEHSRTRLLRPRSARRYATGQWPNQSRVGPATVLLLVVRRSGERRPLSRLCNHAEGDALGSSIPRRPSTGQAESPAFRGVPAHPAGGSKWHEASVSEGRRVAAAGAPSPSEQRFPSAASGLRRARPVGIGGAGADPHLQTLQSLLCPTAAGLVEAVARSVVIGGWCPRRAWRRIRAAGRTSGRGSGRRAGRAPNAQ